MLKKKKNLYLTHDDNTGGSKYERRTVCGLFTSENKQLKINNARVGAYIKILRDKKRRLFQFDACPKTVSKF